MISLGIDIGTTSICAVLYDLTEDKIIKSLSTPNSFINTGSYLQDPDRIVSLAKELLKELLMEFKAWAGEHEARNIRKPAGVGFPARCMVFCIQTGQGGRYPRFTPGKMRTGTRDTGMASPMHVIL